MSKKKDNRFEIVLEEKLNTFSACRILKDKETGVLYLYHAWVDGGGLTPLLGSDGKPVVEGVAVIDYTNRN